MKFYLASRWSNRFRLRELRDRLVQHGHLVTSRWIDNPDRPDSKEEIEKFWGQWAAKDIEDMDNADALILMTWNCTDKHDQPRGGMRFEEGYCYAKGKPIFVLGHRVIVFDQLADIHYCENELELGVAISAINRR